MKAFILAAGLGMRLRPITETVPKVLVPVAGVPMLDRILGALQRAGLSEIALNTHHLPEAVAAHLAALQVRHPALAVRRFHEAELLGTGGALVNAAAFWRDDPLLLWNGDVVADLDVGALGNALARDPDALAVLAVQDRPERSRLLVDAAGRLVGVDSTARGGRRVVTPPQGEPRPLAFTGVSVLAPALLPRIERPGPFDLIDALLEAMARGGRVLAHDVGGAFWGTHGSADELAALEQALTARPDVLARFAPPG